MSDAPDVHGMPRAALHMLEFAGRTQSDLRRLWRKPGQSRSEAEAQLWRLLMMLSARGFATHHHRFWTITPKGEEALRNARARKAAEAEQERDHA